MVWWWRLLLIFFGLAIEGVLLGWYLIRVRATILPDPVEVDGFNQLRPGMISLRHGSIENPTSPPWLDQVLRLNIALFLYYIWTNFTCIDPNILGPFCKVEFNILNDVCSFYILSYPFRCFKFITQISCFLPNDSLFNNIFIRIVICPKRCFVALWFLWYTLSGWSCILASWASLSRILEWRDLIHFATESLVGLYWQFHNHDL